MADQKITLVSTKDAELSNDPSDLAHEDTRLYLRQTQGKRTGQVEDYPQMGYLVNVYNRTNRKNRVRIGRGTDYADSGSEIVFSAKEESSQIIYVFLQGASNADDVTVNVRINAGSEGLFTLPNTSVRWRSGESKSAYRELTVMFNALKQNVTSIPGRLRFEADNNNYQEAIANITIQEGLQLADVTCTLSSADIDEAPLTDEENNQWTQNPLPTVTLTWTGDPPTVDFTTKLLFKQVAGNNAVRARISTSQSNNSSGTNTITHTWKSTDDPADFINTATFYFAFFSDHNNLENEEVLLELLTKSTEVNSLYNDKIDSCVIRHIDKTIPKITVTWEENTLEPGVVKDDLNIDFDEGTSIELNFNCSPEPTLIDGGVTISIIAEIADRNIVNIEKGVSDPTPGSKKVTKEIKWESPTSGS